MRPQRQGTHFSTRVDVLGDPIHNFRCRYFPHFNLADQVCDLLLVFFDLSLESSKRGVRFPFHLSSLVHQPRKILVIFGSAGSVSDSVQEELSNSLTPLSWTIA